MTRLDAPGLLALLHRGGRSLRTVRLTGFTRTDHEVVSRAVERWNRAHGNTAGTIYAALGPAAERPRYVEETTRLWIERPDKIREETAGPYPRRGVQVGETWWLFNEQQGAITNGGAANHTAGFGQQYELLLEPALLIPQFDFELDGEETQAGRAVLRVHGRRRPAHGRHEHLPPLPRGCDACSFLVDLEHGTLLRLTALYDGEPGVDVQITDIGYDEQLPPDTFVFEVPPGEAIVNVTERQTTRRQSIEEVARNASFTVFVATGLDEPWQMHPLHLAPRRGQTQEHVHLHYHRDDATHSFGINEQRADAPLFFTALSEPEEIEHEGTSMRVIRPTEQSPLGSVRLIRDGTSIEVTSDNLPLERLLEIAGSLRAFRA